MEEACRPNGEACRQLRVLAKKQVHTKPTFSGSTYKFR
jgi:hypothetical protein